jgi:hypothetical protein
MATKKITNLHTARERRAETYWRTIMSEDANLTALRDGFMTFMVGCTRDEADKAIAQIIAGWGMRPDQLPAVVKLLATSTGLGTNATLLWLHSTVIVMTAGPGRVLCRQLGPAADRIEGGNGGETSH